MITDNYLTNSHTFSDISTMYLFNINLSDFDLEKKNEKIQYRGVVHRKIGICVSLLCKLIQLCWAICQLCIYYSIWFIILL